MEFDNIVCTSCFKYNECKEYEKSKRKSLRKCQTAICELYYTKINNKDVLEVGCGNRKKGGLIKKTVENNNCKWTGIDIKETDLTTYVCSVTRMPFDDNSFDWVIGSQTLEHWKRPVKALKEIRRVLKSDGKVSLTAPVHLHGGDMFVSGGFNAIGKLFLKSGFNIEKAETWRKYRCDASPISPVARSIPRVSFDHKRFSTGIFCRSKKSSPIILRITLSKREPISSRAGLIWARYCSVLSLPIQTRRILLSLLGGQSNL